MPGAPTWIWPAYYAASGWFLVSGGLDVLNGFGVLDRSHHIRPVTLVAGIITVLIGAGLLAKVEFIRAIVNFFCFVRIALSLLSGIGALAVMSFNPGLGLLMLIFSILDLCIAGLMIYLIGETD